MREPVGATKRDPSACKRGRTRAACDSQRADVKWDPPVLLSLTWALMIIDGNVLKNRILRTPLVKTTKMRDEIVLG